MDYSQVCLEYKKSKELPEWRYHQNLWSIKFIASPVTEEGRKKRDKNSRLVIYGTTNICRVRVDEAIIKKLKKKSKKYGKFEIPFLIFVNVIREHYFCDDDIIMDALCGKEVVDYITYKNGSHETKPHRELNGIWTDPKLGITRKHISGIIFTSGLSSGTIHTIKPVLWHHPNANFPIDMNMLNIEQRYFDTKTGQLKIYNTVDKNYER